MCPPPSTKTVVLSTNINQNGYGSVFDFTLPAMQRDFDEVVIRNLSLQDAVSNGIFFVWSSLTSSVIGSLCVDVSPAQIQPNLHITLHGSTPSNVSFGVQQLNASNSYIPSTAAAILSVTLEFRKFRA